jgi:hypothetical protein
VSRARSFAFLLVGAALLHAPAASAQSASPPEPRFELGIGGLWMGTASLGSKTATETTGSGAATPLFNTSSELAAAFGVEGRIGVRVFRSLVAEADASYLKPQLRIATSADTESAAPVTATETVEQVTIGGSVLWYLGGGHRWPRFAPFLMAGAGYLRQLHEQGTLVAEGRFYQFGGGANLLLVSSRRFHTKGVGARVDFRALIRSKGIAFDGGSTTSPAAGVSAFVRF